MNLTPKEILDDLLGHLGFVCEIEETGTPTMPVLMVHTHDASLLVGQNGAVLEDLQYLLNRLLIAQQPNAPRVAVDIEHHRAMRDDGLLSRVRGLADQVRATGRPVQLEPLNSYDRRLVHQEFKEDPDVMSVSPKEEGRLKRITLQKRA